LLFLDFYAPPLLREAEAAAAPRESFGFQRGLVAPAFGSGATAIVPGSADPFSLKTVHWTVFQALEPTKPAEKRLELQPDPLELAPVAF